MNPPLFSILNSSVPVKALLGSNPLRVYPNFDAPQDVAKPYAVYGVYNGNPENYLDRRPDMDNMGTQINIYAANYQSALDVYEAITYEVEAHAHVTSFSTPGKDADTMLYTARIDVDFRENR